GCCTGRGPHRAVLYALKATRRYRWRLQLDIARYFASVQHDVLLELYARRLRDRRTMALLERIVAVGGHMYQSTAVREVVGQVPEGPGIAVGSYVSHFSGALYLDGADQHIKRVLRVPGYLRYMDDLLLFGDDQGTLVDARDALVDWLAHERGLRLKTPS